jgi:hypothetical protein
MRIRIVIGLGLAAMMAAAACGSDGGDGPPGSGGSTGVDAADEPDPPDPGICHKLCCSTADCASGETCTPFDAANGTLGTCSGSGWGADGGGVDPDAGTGSELPAGCWTLNTAACNPVTNQGCADPTDICDYSAQEDNEFEPMVDCYASEATQGAGQPCDNVDGPDCFPGFHCVSNN